MYRRMAVVGIVLSVVMFALYVIRLGAFGRVNDERGEVQVGLNTLPEKSDKGDETDVSGGSAAFKSAQRLIPVPANGVSDTLMLQHLIDTRGLDDGEVGYAVSLALDLCDDRRFGKQVTVDDMIRAWESQGKIETARMAQRAVDRFCRTSLEFSIDEDQSLALSDPSAYLYLHSPLLRENQSLIDAMSAGVGGDELLSDMNQLAAVVRRSVRRAEGLFEFMELISLYSENGRPNILPLALGDFGYPDMAARNVVSTGAVLAGCRIFGGCGPESILATMVCFGGGCPYPMGLEEHARYTLSPRDLERAEMVARALIAARTHSGD